MPLADARHRSHDLAGRTDAALKSAVVDESGLQRMKMSILRQTLNGSDLVAIGGVQP